MRSRCSPTWPIRLASNGRAIPYSLVAAVDGAAWTEVAGDDPLADPIVLNEWAARDLSARVGDGVRLTYWVWLEEGRLEERFADFKLTHIVPMTGLAADRELTPEYPGITGSAHLSDWDPPFPIDLGRVRKQDEDYWDRYRATPKAFIPLARGQQLWRHRLGALTSVRVIVPKGADAAALSSRYADSAAGPGRAAGDGLRGGAGPGGGRARLGRQHRLRRVLPLLQLVPGRVGAAPDRAVLPLRGRAAPP